MLSKLALAALLAGCAQALPETASVTVGDAKYDFAFGAPSTVSGPAGTITIYEERSCEAPTNLLETITVAADTPATVAAAKLNVLGRAVKVGEACAIISQENVLTTMVDAIFKVGENSAYAELKTPTTNDFAGLAELEWGSELFLTATVSKLVGEGDHQFKVASTCEAGADFFPAGGYADLTTPRSDDETKNGGLMVFADGDADATSTLTTKYDSDFKAKKLQILKRGAKIEGEPITYQPAAIVACGDVITLATFDAYFGAYEKDGKTIISGKVSGLPAGPYNAQVVSKKDDTDTPALSCGQPSSIGERVEEMEAPLAVNAVDNEDTVFEIVLDAELSDIEGKAIVIGTENTYLGCGVIGGQKDTVGDGSATAAPNGASAGTVSLAAMTIMGAAMMN